MGNLQQVIPVKDSFADYFSTLTEEQNFLQTIFPVFRNIYPVITKEGQKMCRVEFDGILQEVSEFKQKWSEREQHPSLFLVQGIFSNEINKAILYLDYPENHLTMFQTEFDFLECLDVCLSLFVKWQLDHKFSGYIGRQTIYEIYQKQKIYKIIDQSLRPHHITLYRYLLQQQSLTQVSVILNNYFISPILLHNLAGKVEYAKHNPYKSDVFSLGLLFYSCLTQINSFYDLETFTVNIDEEAIDKLHLRHYTKLILKHMLQLNEDDRPDFIQLDQQFTTYANEMNHIRHQQSLQKMLFVPDIPKQVDQEDNLQNETIEPEIEDIDNNQKMISINSEMYLKFDPEQKFDEVSFTQKSETPATNTVPSKQSNKIRSDFILNNIKQKSSIQGQIQIVKKIQLPCLGHQDLSNWHIAEGVVIRNKLEGEVVLQFTNGDKFKGRFEADKANGPGLYYYQGMETPVAGNWTNNIFEYLDLQL